jgi:hypothetical protein
MKVIIPPKPADDPQFVELVCRIISGLLNANAVEEVFVVQIDNWFDHKWLNFSGKGRVRFDDWRIDIDTALDGFHQENITFPPFTPNRVVEEYYYLRDPGGTYVASGAAPFVHSRRRAASCWNLQRRVTGFSDSAIFAWFSSNTAANRRGSVMVYKAYGRRVTTWYAAFAKTERWEILRVDGADRAQLQIWLERDYI